MLVDIGYDNDLTALTCVTFYSSNRSFAIAEERQNVNKPDNNSYTLSGCYWRIRRIDSYHE